MVDDSHATGFMGKTGRGTLEHCGVAGTRGHHHHHLRQGPGRRPRGLHRGEQGDHRPPPPAQPALPVLQHPGPGRGGGHPARPRAAHREHGAARPARGQHGTLPRAHDGGGLRDPARRAPHRAHHVLALRSRRRAPGPALRPGPAGRGHLREGLLLPGGAEGQGADPRAALGGPRARAHRPRRRSPSPRWDARSACWEARSHGPKTRPTARPNAS